MREKLWNNLAICISKTNNCTSLKMQISLQFKKKNKKIVLFKEQNKL